MDYLVGRKEKKAISSLSFQFPQSLCNSLIVKRCFKQTSKNIKLLCDKNCARGLGQNNK